PTTRRGSASWTASWWRCEPTRRARWCSATWSCGCGTISRWISTSTPTRPTPRSSPPATWPRCCAKRRGRGRRPAGEAGRPGAGGRLPATPMKPLSVPGYVASICAVLKDAGYEAYAVGGGVRDALLGRAPKDWDVATSAPPEEVQRLFPRTVPTGIEFGTVTVLMNGHAVEVTTFRGESGYYDGRH